MLLIKNEFTFFIIFSCLRLLFKSFTRVFKNMICVHKLFTRQCLSFTEDSRSHFSMSNLKLWSCFSLLLFCTSYIIFDKCFKLTRKFRSFIGTHLWSARIKLMITFPRPDEFKNLLLSYFCRKIKTREYIHKKRQCSRRSYSHDSMTFRIHSFSSHFLLIIFYIYLNCLYALHWLLKQGLISNI